jgi:phosphoribosylformimino-5-aminoimidazole carboxamide ribotide isomerase
VDLIPVVDIRGGKAVRAVAGDRQRYAPLVSRWTQSVEPATVVRAVHDAFGLPACYVADLDAIESRARSADRSDSPAPGNRCAIAEMCRSGIRLTLDAGVTTVEHAVELAELGVNQVVVASESLPDPDALAAIVRALGPEHVTFSLDLKLGRPLVACAGWNQVTPLAIGDIAVHCGVRRLIVLDLAAVGTGTGLASLPLCESLRQRHPELHITSGGGVSSLDDVHRGASAGLDALLIASALHDGRLSPEAVTSFTAARGQQSGC